MKIYSMLHLLPLDNHGITKKQIIEDALRKAKCLQLGGAKRVIVENNYDHVFGPTLSQSSYNLMRAILRDLRKRQFAFELGLCIRWSAPELCLQLASEFQLTFVRLPVFADNIRARHGIYYNKISGNFAATELLQTAKNNGVKIMTDIQVKHSKLMSPRTYIESIDASFRLGSDIAIIAAKSGNRIPRSDLLTRVRRHIDRDWPEKKCLVGGGVSLKTLLNLRKVDGVIIGKAIKTQCIENESEWVVDPIRVKAFHDLCEATFGTC